MAEGESLGSLARSISFRAINPEDGAKALARWKRVEFRLRRLGISLETMNTALPAPLRSSGREVRRVLGIPRMSTLAIGTLVNHAVRRQERDECFVNVGVWHGFTLLAGVVGNPDRQIIGVDNFSEFGGPRDDFLARWDRFHTPPHHRFFDLDFLEYFKEHSGVIGTYYYDGAHDYDSQYRGLTAAEPFFGPRVVIFVDDWNNPDAREATRRFVDEREGYAVTFERRTAANEHPTFWNGLAIIERS